MNRAAVSLLSDCGIQENFQGFCSGRFFHAAQSDARRAHLHLLPHAIHHRTHSLQIRIPPPAARIIRVAYHIPVARPFAANFTLQCHNSPLPKLQKIENKTLNSIRCPLKHKTLLMRNDPDGLALGFEHF
jgi:hypothetical protein